MYDRDYYLAHKDKFREWSYNWHRNNPEKVKAAKLKYVTTHKDLVHKRVQIYDAKLKRQALQGYSPNLVCARCGFNDLRALGLDHVNNNGAAHRRKTGASGTATYRWVIKNNYPDGFQVLCASCGWLKQSAIYENKLSVGRRRNQEIREIVLRVYSPTLICKCGENNFKVLTLDHINGGGKREVIKVGKRGISFYRWLHNQYLQTGVWPKGYQVLCWNCQLIKERGAHE